MLQPIKDKTAICKVMKFLEGSDQSLFQAEYQLSKINLVDWVHKDDTEVFWSKLDEYKDAIRF